VSGPFASFRLGAARVLLKENAVMLLHRFNAGRMDTDGWLGMSEGLDLEH